MITYKTEKECSCLQWYAADLFKVKHSKGSKRKYCHPAKICRRHYGNLITGDMFSKKTKLASIWNMIQYQLANKLTRGKENHRKKKELFAPLMHIIYHRMVLVNIV